MGKATELLDKLLFRSSGRMRMRLAATVLCIGNGLLFLSVLAWWNFNTILNSDEGDSHSGAVYMMIAREVTEHNMGMSGGSSFTAGEVADIANAPEVMDAGALTPARFPVYATIGGRVAMATDLPLASVPDRFIDEIPEGWSWQPGQRNLPVIISSQFLNVYNYVFAPGQGLPQLSRTSVKSVGITLQVGGENGMHLSAHIAGFSDRVSSILVPHSFIAYGNKQMGIAAGTQEPSQLIVKVRDPSKPAFTEYLRQHGYTTNPQSLQWSKLRTVVASVAGVMGGIALLLVVISIMVILFFIELTITRGAASIALLQQIGYSRQFLKKYLIRRFVPTVIGSVSVALLVSCAAQVVVHNVAANQGMDLPLLPGWPVVGTYVACLSALVQIIRIAVNRTMKL